MITSYLNVININFFRHEDTRGRISVSKCTMYNVTPMEIISNDFEKIEIGNFLHN